MQINELVAKCQSAIEAGTGHICLVIPGPPPRGERVRLDRSSRKRCPMGEVANWQDDPPRTVAYFDAIDVLAWLAANSFVEIAEPAEEPDHE